MVNATTIEKTEAVYPRIVIDQQIMRKLYNNGTFGNYAFINKEGNCHFIDFYNGLLTWYHFYEKKETMSEIISGVVNDATSKIEQNVGDKHVVEKYEWVLKYLSWRCKTGEGLMDLFKYETENYDTRGFKMMIEVNKKG